MKINGKSKLLAIVTKRFFCSAGCASKSMLYSFNFWINCEAPTGISTRIVCGRFPSSGLEA